MVEKPLVWGALGAWEVWFSETLSLPIQELLANKVDVVALICVPFKREKFNAVRLSVTSVTKENAGCFCV